MSEENDEGMGVSDPAAVEAAPGPDGMALPNDAADETMPGVESADAGQAASGAGPGFPADPPVNVMVDFPDFESTHPAAVLEAAGIAPGEIVELPASPEEFAADPAHLLDNPSITDKGRAAVRLTAGVEVPVSTDPADFEATHELVHADGVVELLRGGASYAGGALFHVDGRSLKAEDLEAGAVIRRLLPR